MCMPFHYSYFIKWGVFQQPMPTLLACLSSGKGTWTEVYRITQAQPWTKVFLITNAFGKENYKGPAAELILVDFMQDPPALVQSIVSQLTNKITDFEIALNLASGTGKEHMAILEAVMELGLNFRLVTFVGNRMEILGLALK